MALRTTNLAHIAVGIDFGTGGGGGGSGLSNPMENNEPITWKDLLSGLHDVLVLDNTDVFEVGATGTDIPTTIRGGAHVNISVDDSVRLSVLNNGVVRLIGGLAGSRPVASSGIAGGLYYSSDTHILSYATPSGWVDLSGGVTTARAINTTSPLMGGGDLSADRTLSILNASVSNAGAVTTGAQVFGGRKGVADGLNIYADTYPPSTGIFGVNSDGSDPRSVLSYAVFGGSNQYRSVSIGGGPAPASLDTAGIYANGLDTGNFAGLTVEGDGERIALSFATAAEALIGEWTTYFKADGILFRNHMGALAGRDISFRGYDAGDTATDAVGSNIAWYAGHGRGAAAGSGFSFYPSLTSAVSGSTLNSDVLALTITESAVTSLIPFTVTASHLTSLLGGLRLDVGSDATGDIYYRNSTPRVTRLGIGSSGTFLKSNGSVPSWASITTSDVSGAVATSFSISTTVPLTGGGDFTTPRTFALSYSTGLTVTSSNLVVDQSFAPTWTGVHTFNNNVVFGDATSDTVTFTSRAASDFVPSTNNARDLGVSATQWRTGYFGTSVLTPIVGVDATHQHTVPNVSNDTLALLAATQTLTNKTLSTGTKITLSSDAIGDLYYNTNGATGTLGRLGIGSSGQFLWVSGGLPAWRTLVAGDVSGAVATSRTLTGTSPIQIDGSNSAQDLSANRTISILSASTSQAGAVTTSAQSFGGAKTVVLDDGTQSAVSDVLTLVHSYNAGAGAVGIGTGLLFRAENASSAIVDAARIYSILSNVTAGIEGGNIRFATRTGGGSLTDRWFMNSAGHFLASTDNSIDIGGGGNAPRYTYAATSLIAPAIGQNTGQIHTVPVVASDTLALLAATQTLTNKTLGTGTKILLGSDATGDLHYNGGSGTLTRLAAGTSGFVLTAQGAGAAPVWAANAATPTTRSLTGTAPIQIDGSNSAQDLSANRTISIVDAAFNTAGAVNTSTQTLGAGAKTIRVADTNTASSVTAFTVTHSISTGTPANNIGVKQIFQLPNASGTLKDAFIINVLLEDAGAGTEKSSIDFQPMYNGSNYSNFKLGADGTITTGVGNPVLFGGLIRVANNQAVYSEGSGGGGYYPLAQLTSGNVTMLGNTSFATKLLSGATITLESAATTALTATSALVTVPIAFKTTGTVQHDLGSDATGDMFSRSSGGTLARVVPGASGTVLTSNGTGVAPTFQTISAIGNTINQTWSFSGAVKDYTADAGWASDPEWSALSSTSYTGWLGDGSGGTTPYFYVALPGRVGGTSGCQRSGSSSLLLGIPNATSTATFPTSTSGGPAIVIPLPYANDITVEFTLYSNMPAYNVAVGALATISRHTTTSTFIQLASMRVTRRYDNTFGWVTEQQAGIFGTEASATTAASWVVSTQYQRRIRFHIRGHGAAVQGSNVGTFAAFTVLRGDVSTAFWNATEGPYILTLGLYGNGNTANMNIEIINLTVNGTRVVC